MVRVVAMGSTAVGRAMLSDLLAPSEDVRVVATLGPRRGIMRRVEQLNADVILLETAETDTAGMALLRSLVDEHSPIPVVVLSSDAVLGGRVVSLAREAKAAGCVRRPADPDNLKKMASERLIPLIVAVGRASAHTRSRTPTPTPAVAVGRPPNPPAARRASGPARALVIGCSTGGPNALSELLPRLPADLGVPVLIVQHMPPRFTTLLAERLDQTCRLGVCEASTGEQLEPGRVYLAPGGTHMRVETVAGRQRVSLDSDPPVNSCRPSVDVMFQSAVDVWGGNLCAAVLTGMGLDGLAGARALVEAGGFLVAQDEATSVVWGMPKAVVEAGLASDVLPIDRIAERITRAIREMRTPRRGVA